MTAEKNQVAVPFGGNGVPMTMSSREIAELVEARHNDVVATIERLFNKGLLRSSRKTRRESTGGRPLDVYDLTERDSHLVVAGYSDEHRAKVVDRWQELEAQAATPAFAVPTSFSQALMLAAQQAEQIEKQQAALAIAAPKAQALDRIAKADGELCITDTAKTIQIAPRKLFAWMQSHGWIFRRGDKWVAYQDRIDSGHLIHRATVVQRKDGSDKEVTGVMVTAKGQAKLAEVAV